MTPINRPGPWVSELLEPMADVIGVDLYQAFFRPPSTDAERVAEALRCAAEFLFAFTEAEMWATGDPDMPSKRGARRLARKLNAGMTGITGMATVSQMAQEYGRATAAIWLHAAERPAQEQADQLRISAHRSDALAAMVERTWPVDDPFDARARFDASASDQWFDPNSDDPMIDFYAYDQQVRATGRALSLALGHRVDRRFDALLAPVLELQPIYHLSLASSWNHTLAFWSNTLADDPVSHQDVISQLLAAREHAR